MKKSFYFIAAIAVLAACNKTDAPETVVDAPETFVGTPISSLTVSSAPVSKTATDGTLQVLWTAGDQIAVYGYKSGKVAEPFTITGSGGANTATFSGEAVDCVDYGVAVYPYVTPDQHSDDKYRQMTTTGAVYTWVLREQHYVANSIPDESLVMASRFDPTVGTMTFTALASVLEVKLYGTVSIKKIKVEEYATADAASMGGKNLSGRVKITFDENGVPTPEATESSYVDYICDTPVALSNSADAATSFFIVLAGNASFNHLNLIITDGDNKDRTIKIGGSGETTTLAPGKVYSLPAKEVLPVSSTILAKWVLDGSYDMGEFYTGSKNQVETSGTGNALPTAGAGYITFKNNDWETGTIKTFRTNYTNTPSQPSNHLCFIPVTNSDEIIIAATGCSLASGDQVQLQGCLWAYASGTNVGKYSTCATYELDYSLDGTTWNKIKDITLTANTNSNPIGNTAAGYEAEDIVTLTASSTQILFRFLATSNQGTGSQAISTNGQTRLCCGGGNPPQLAILKL